MIITVEGIDSSGKSTLIKSLVHRQPDLFVAVRDVGVDELTKAKDTFNKFGIDTTDPDTLQILYNAILATTELELNRIVATGKIPLVDRYIDTLVVYASLFTNYRHPLAMHKQMARLFEQSCTPRPDLTFYIDIDYDDVVYRLRKRKELGMLERFSPDTYQAIKSGFFQQMADSNRRFVVMPKGLSQTENVDFCLRTIETFRTKGA